MRKRRLGGFDPRGCLRKAGATEALKDLRVNMARAL
jgi:hypothetical protein